MRQLTGTEAGTLSGLLSYGTYVLDFRLKGTLCAGITRPECRRFKCMELTHLSRDQLQETAVYDARQAVPRPFHHVHLYANQLLLGSRLIYQVGFLPNLLY